jgi:hypothetical protein
MPAYAAFVFVALHAMPSYSTSAESATVLHQNGCAWMRSARTTALRACESVRAIGRPSPSARVRFAKYVHHV